MDPTTAHQQSRPGSEPALNSNSAGQTINVANGHGDSDERIPTASDDGASDDDAAVDDGVAQSPLSRESDEDTRAQDSWMDLGMSFTPADAGAGHPILMHGRVLSYELRGTMTKPRSSSSASRAVHIPALSKAALQDGTYQPGGAYHTTHEARLDHAGARAAWNITGLWGVSLLNSREKLLAELFPDLNQEYNDWHLTSNDPLQAFREQREDADPDADLKIWQLDGALLSTPAMEANQSNSRPLRSMAYAGRLPPVWPFLDDPVAESLHLLNLEEFTELVNGCAPDVIVRHSFAILRTLVTARYLHAKVQGLHKELRATHMEINDLEAERVRLRQAIPTDAVVGQASRLGRLSGTQLEAMASTPQSPEALAQIQTERIRLAEWERDQLQGQLQLAERSLTRERDEHRRALTQSLERGLDLEERLRVSIASEREAEARSTQQATSFAESRARFEQQLATCAASSARLEQQLASNRTNDERIRQCLRSRHWTDAEIHTLMSPSSPSSSSAAPGGNASSSSSNRPAPMTPGSGDISSMYALSHVGGAGDSSSATRGPMGNTASKSFTPSKPGDGLRAFAVEASATTQLPANDTLQAVHGALLSVKPVRLDGASLTARQVHAFCDHLEVLLRSRVFDPQTFTLLKDPQSIMAIGLRFMTSKVMARVPVADWKTDW
jgi:hypothetical protein